MAKFQFFSLRGSEKLSIKMVEQDFKEGTHEYSLCCVGRFMWGKPINIKAYRTVMCQVVGCLDLHIVKFQNRVHQIFFPNKDSPKGPLNVVLGVLITIC